MNETGTDEQRERVALDSALTVAALAACVVAISASGGLAIVAGAVAALCLAGSVAASLSPRETPFEEFCRECDQVAAVQAGQEISEGLAQEAEHLRLGLGHHWRQAVAASNPTGRSR